MHLRGYSMVEAKSSAVPKKICLEIILLLVLITQILLMFKQKMNQILTFTTKRNKSVYEILPYLFSYQFFLISYAAYFMLNEFIKHILQTLVECLNQNPRTSSM